MQKLIRTAGLFLFLGILTLTACSKADWEMFIDFASLLLVTATAAGLTLMKYREGTTRANILRSLKLYLIASGIIACTLSAIIMMCYMSDIAAIGPAIAVSLIAPFYSTILVCIVDTLIPHKLATTEKAVPNTQSIHPVKSPSEIIIRTIGLFLFLGIISLTVFSRSHWPFMLDFGSLLFAVASPLGLALMKYRKGTTTINILRNLRLYLFASAIIITFIHIIHFMLNLADPTPIGPAIAFPLLAPLYSIILACIVDTLIPKKQPSPRTPEKATLL